MVSTRARLVGSLQDLTIFQFSLMEYIPLSFGADAASTRADLVLAAENVAFFLLVLSTTKASSNTWGTMKNILSNFTTTGNGT